MGTQVEAGPSELDGILSQVFSGQPVGAQFGRWVGANAGLGLQSCLKLCLLVPQQPFCGHTGSRQLGLLGSGPGLLLGSHRWAALRSALLKGSPVFLQTMLTAISMSAIATNGVVPGEGVLEAGLSETKPAFCE